MSIEFFVADTMDGEDERIQYLCGLLSEGYYSYFKLGEGGYGLPVSATTEQIATGDGGTDYTGTISNTPLAPGEVEIDDGAQTLADDGIGGFTGDGSGTVNYKTGEVDVTFNAAVTGGTGIDATYKTRGGPSPIVTKKLGNGDGTVGTYNYVLDHKPVSPSSITIDDGGSQTLTDDGAGNLTGNGAGIVDYDTGRVVFDFNAAVHELRAIAVEYKYTNAPSVPADPTSKSDLDSETSSALYTFTKSFEAGTIAFVEDVAGRLRCRLQLELYEGIDDGSGNTPVFYECGLFSESGVMMKYFTFQGFANTGGAIVDLESDTVI